MKQQLESILAEFKAPGLVRQVREGPVVNTLLVELGAGVRVKKVASLEDDIALRLGVNSVRVVPNVPGVAYLGVEVPRNDRQIVRWEPRNSTATLPMALGVDTLGERVEVDLAKAPHVLVAGATGSGKSVAVHTMILSLVSSATPVRLVLIDPKMLEFRSYEGLASLATPVITDAMAATAMLNRLCREMDERYALLAAQNCRDIASFNRKVAAQAQARRLFKRRLDPMSYIVTVVDEWADLHAMQGKGIELPVVRLAQKARACGIHLVLATQRPSVKVLPGLIKANFPARIALKVTNMTDSRVILDQNGAERLLGLGDMLVSGFGFNQPTRVHGAFVDPDRVLNVKLA